MTPYETMCQLLSREGSIQTQSRLYQTMTQFVVVVIYSEFNMCLGVIGIYLHAPLIAVEKKSVLQDPYIIICISVA